MDKAVGSGVFFIFIFVNAHVRNIHIIFIYNISIMFGVNLPHKGTEKTE